ncbi:MAG: type IV pilus modification protein PilV [Magnetococcales bacterium]|nr:type IV pilus modification protein PilV [Magnetococcales bacterium]
MSMISRFRSHDGFTLLEVLITLIIVAVSLLGLAKLQLNAMRFTHSAHWRGQALLLGYDILERMRANRVLAIQGAYGIDFDTLPTVAPDCLTASCTPHQIVQHDLARWKQDLTTLLPDGDGEITRINSGGLEHLFHISIRWDDDRRSEVISYRIFDLESEL